MTNLHLRHFVLAALLVLGLIAAPPASPADERGDPESEGQSAAAEAVQSEVDKAVEEKAAERRRRLLANATTAINETRRALRALDENKPDEALAALEVATGKLELITARDPELALAPVNVTAVTHDTYATPETIETVIDRAVGLLKDGEVQRARPLVANLASEIVFETANIPLATYPEAIKAAVPLIDEGKTDEAAHALQAALNTMVVTADLVIPLPLVRAGAMLEGAEKLAEKEDRTDRENEDLAALLEGTRTQLRMAKLLGYGEEDDFEPMYEQLDKIEKKTEGGKSEKGLFDRIKNKLSGMME